MSPGDCHLPKSHSVVSRQNKYQQAASFIIKGQAQVLKGQLVLVPLYPPKIILHGITGVRNRVSVQGLRRRRTQSMSSFLFYASQNSMTSNKNLIQKLMKIHILSRI
jgi:hypothetical protein